jgi:hypothetical protein
MNVRLKIVRSGPVEHLAVEPLGRAGGEEAPEPDQRPDAERERGGEDSAEEAVSASDRLDYRGRPSNQDARIA